MLDFCTVCGSVCSSDPVIADSVCIECILWAGEIEMKGGDSSDLL